jgi:hypothetical protein
MVTTIMVIWVHFIADFVLQTDAMAVNKSKSSGWLGIHSLCYGLPFLIWGWRYAAVNAVCHFFIDGITSRGTARLWQEGERHWFFVLIGFDQALHLTVLFLLLGVL